MVTVAIAGVLAATAIPAFMKYVRKAKTTEARQNVRKMYDGARAYYLDRHYASVTDMQPLPAQFPAPPNSGGQMPPHYWDCCSANNASDKPTCDPMPSAFEGATNQGLSFSIHERHYYTYYFDHVVPYLAYDSAFFVKAEGDLDCDDEKSSFSMVTFVDPAYADGPTGTGILRRLNELE
jgi:type IV pilus assembly protein PilA